MPCLYSRLLFLKTKILTIYTIIEGNSVTFLWINYQGLIGKWKVDRYTNLLCHILAYQQIVVFYQARSDAHYCTLTFLFARIHGVLLSLFMNKCVQYLGENQ